MIKYKAIATLMALVFSMNSFAGQNYNLHKDLLFKTVSDREVKLDLYLPTSVEKNKHPLLIWVHGGAWKRGSKDNIPQKNPLLLNSFLKEGYALASVDYRLSGETTFPAQIIDINDAINFLHSHSSEYNIDVDNIAVMGRSAGGHLAALIGATNPHKNIDFYGSEEQPKYNVVSVVSFFGPTDMLRMMDKRTGAQDNTRKSPESMLLGGNPKDVPEVARQASPTFYITKESPPFILLHGDNDTKVPVSQSLILKQLLDENNIDNMLFIEKGGRHSDRVFDTDKYVSEVVSFVKKYLPNNHN